MIRRGGFLLAALATFAPAFTSSPVRWFAGSLAHGFTGAPAVIVASTETPAPAQRAETQGPSDEGIPVIDPVVVRACSSCHTRDDKQRMTRISDRRATPENWELTVRRMMSLNNVQLTSETARAVIKSLSDTHGLAPEEARPVMFEAERRLVDFT
jgi:quinohemoprotein amine dehydrogenase